MKDQTKPNYTVYDRIASARQINGKHKPLNATGEVLLLTLSGNGFNCSINVTDKVQNLHFEFRAVLNSVAKCYSTPAIIAPGIQ